MKNTINRLHSRVVATGVTLALLNACASYGPPVTGAVFGPEKRISDSLPATISEVVLELPVGDVDVVALPGSRLSAEIQISCDERNKSCQKLANNITLKKQVFEDRVFISPSTRSKMAFRKAQSDYQIEVPNHIPLRIIMGYGELSVSGIESDLTIDMKAGEVSVEAPLSQVRKVWADANFGDARLHGTTSEETGGRRFLVGAESSWDDGPGQHDIVVNLGAGDVTISLIPDSSP
ncbi:MAG: hypothetical protein AB8G18_12695 [Gammaproteobacteria bacterium]